MKNMKLVAPVLLIVILLVLTLVGCSTAPQNITQTPPAQTTAPPPTPIDNSPDYSNVASGGILEGGYYAHHEDGSSVRVFTFDGNTFIQYVPYTEIVWGIASVTDRDRHRFQAEDFFSSSLIFSGTFSIDDHARIVRTQLDDLANIRQELYEVFTHPFMLSLADEYSADLGFLHSSDMVNQLVDELIEAMRHNPITGFSYESGFDVLYEIRMDGGNNPFTDYFRPLIRAGFSPGILANFGGNDPTALIGRWEFPENPINAFEFQADGTIIRTSTTLNIPEGHTVTGTWSVFGNLLTMDFGEGNPVWTGDFQFRISYNTLTLNCSSDWLLPSVLNRAS